VSIKPGQAHRGLNVQRSDEPAWKSAGMSTKARPTVAGSSSSARIWFYVTTIGAAGRGPWSDPASKVVP